MEPKSKSQQKREATALQALGEKLTHLSPEQLSQIPLPDELRDAIVEATRITKHGGRKRQLQYIGKLMRRIDAEQITQAVQRLDQQQHQQTEQFHHLEQWRERLMIEGEEAVRALRQEYPNLNQRPLLQLIKDARLEREQQRPPRAYRQLFRFLKGLHGTD